MTTNPPHPSCTIQLDQRSKTLIQDSQDLFCAKPSREIFHRSWNPQATFEDPICIAKGFREYAAQWYSMPKIFSHSKTLSWSPTKVDEEEIRFQQVQLYRVRGLGLEKVMESTVVLRLDEKGRIVSFQDRWDHKPLPNGRVSGFFRRLNARLVPYFVKVETEDLGESGKGK
ncbi:hypothetical protein IE53DRAFT_370776 [Violaceomyces palustris]|uniref:Uncharacterized protein n=1 Tax=Violaceomyces palustris TaxID=1673888 RepID=A0ACD0NR61_9BASI|nr:hypothetical protein IE53DRAFT_370776 [Violaceomyces palustris]